MPLPICFRCPACYLPTWGLLAVSQVQWSTFRCVPITTWMKTELFNADALFTHSKEESGFMAVPLVDKGVVVVAVGYDIAPKGRLFSFPTVDSLPVVRRSLK